MNETHLILLTLAISVGCAAMTYLAGYQIGQTKGRALGWQEGFFYRIEQDKARRDKLGRFKSREVEGGK